MRKTPNASIIGVIGLLGAVFVILKLTGDIDWSWWWVTVPFWGGLGIVLAVLAVVGVTYHRWTPQEKS